MMTYAFVGANTAGAWRWEGRLADAHLASANLATLHDVLSPGAQVDLWHTVAWDTWISVWI